MILKYRKYFELTLIFIVVLALVWGLISYTYAYYSKDLVKPYLDFKIDVFGFFLSIIVLTTVLFFIFRQFLMKINFIAKVNDRSSHSHVVVNGLGIVFILVLAPILYAVQIKIHTNTNFLTIIATSSIVIAVVSLLDDLIELRSAIRFLTQILVVAISMYLWRPTHGYLGLNFPTYIDVTITFLGWVFFINIYNFMDGIDGITGIGTIAIALGIAFVLITISFTGESKSALHLRIVFIMMIIIALSLSFLIFNWHKSLGFMGDVGSAMLGYMLGGFLLYTASQGHYVDAVLIASYQMGDISFSIVRLVICHKHKPWIPHREFHFHRALRAGYSQQQILLIVSICELLLLTIVATHILVEYSPYIAFILGFVTTIIFLMIFHISFKKRQKIDPDI